MESTPASRQAEARRSIGAALGCALAGFAIFQFLGNANRGYIDTRSLFHWWGYQWMNPASETEHGWLILAGSAWLFWRRVRMPPPEPPATSGAVVSETPPAAPSVAPAVGAMAVGLGLHIVGFAAQQARISIVALLIFAWGVLRLAGGRTWGAAAVFPLAFLLFALPVSVLDELGLPLRVAVTAAGEGIARAAGIEVLRSGTQLVAPDGRFNYDVAAPCSGVRSLMALTALSLLLGYLNFRTWPRRLLVFLLCFPLVYAGNVARIVSIVFAAQWGGPEWGERAHAVMGFGVFAIVLGGVLAFVSLLRRRWPEGPEPVAVLPVEPPASARSTWIAAGVVVFLAAGTALVARAIADRPLRGDAGVLLAADGVNPVELPAFLGTEWLGRRSEVSAVEREILPPDTGFSRKSYAFVEDRRKDVFLSIVLSGRDRSSIHRPELCLVGQGWTIDRAGPHDFQFPPDATGTKARFPSRLLRVRREVATARGRVVVPQLVAYWFVGGDTIVASHWKRLALDAWNRVAHGRADRWAYILVQTDASDGEEAALRRMQGVLDQTLPRFQRPPS